MPFPVFPAERQSFDRVMLGFTHPISDWTQIPITHERAQIYIDERTAANKWCGESMDYGLAVQVLLQQESRRGVAGTFAAWAFRSLAIASNRSYARHFRFFAVAKK